jgi:hypothetical protein
VFSRHRFVWPCFRETTETAILACEAAWEFFGGVFEVLIPDNTMAIVLQRQAAERGEAVGRFVKALLDGPLPWTRIAAGLRTAGPVQALRR